MSTRIRRFLLLFSFLLPITLCAQNRNVSGRLVIDDEGQELKGLPYASVIIMNSRDSSFVKGVTSDEKGFFHLSFSEKKNNSYILKASYLGFTSIYRALNDKEKHIKLGVIKLQETDIELGEVVVTGHIPEVELIGDTTVINTSVYKTPEGSHLEDLVKRIPGLDYDRQNKSLTYNGLQINEINVNGETYFGGDMTMALENLPVELIDKIKVYNKKSELEKSTGVSTGRENYVLDLQTKKEFNGTLLASAKAGYGNHNKKDFELLTNYFKEGGNSFTALARSGNRNMMTSSKDNRQDNLGINFVKKINKDININGNVNYNWDKMVNESTAYYEQYLTGGNKYQYSANESSNRNRMINSTLGTYWQINKKTSFYFMGNIGFTEGNIANTNKQASFNTNPQLNISDPFNNPGNIPDDTKINDISMRSLLSNNQERYSFNTHITHEFNEKGSSISLTAMYDSNKGKNDNFTISSTTYYLLDNSLGNDSVLYRNQYHSSPDRMRNSHIGLMLSHPFTKELRMQFSYNLLYNKQQNNRNTYDLSQFMEEAAEQLGYLPPEYEEGYTDSLSNRSHSRTLGHDLAVRMNYSSKIWDISAGISIQPEQRSIDQKTGLLQADTTMRTLGFQPSLMAIWKYKEKSMLRLSYNGNTHQPSLSSLLSLTDNSNPLNITRGNPNLKSTYHQSVRLEAQNTGKGLFATLDWRNEINSQTYAVIYNQQTGGRETYPVNINGNWNTSGMFRYQKRLRNFNISTTGRGSYAQSISLVNEGQSEQPERSKTLSTGINTDIRLSYNPKWGGFDWTGYWWFQHSTNSLRQTDMYTRNYSFSLNAYGDLPGNIQLKTDATYSFRNGTNIKKGEDDQVVWNAGINWRFLKKKQLELSAYWADILSQKKNFSRNTTANGFHENHSQQIGSYFIVSVKYRFNKPL